MKRAQAGNGREIRERERLVAALLDLRERRVDAGAVGAVGGHRNLRRAVRVGEEGRGDVVHRLVEVTGPGREPLQQRSQPRHRAEHGHREDVAAAAGRQGRHLVDHLGRDPKREAIVASVVVVRALEGQAGAAEEEPSRAQRVPAVRVAGAVVERPAPYERDRPPVVLLGEGAIRSPRAAEHIGEPAGTSVPANGRDGSNSCHACTVRAGRRARNPVPGRAHHHVSANVTASTLLPSGSTTNAAK